ncbi:flagellar biosynthesis protein FliQ [Solibacillus sp. A46]|uniref:Flagellar biosynthetic protein FliQ n=2 Tax=Solibacillus TaxID=648800 RepID=A0ABR8XTZ5_9BACL|nr:MULTISPECIES: flagellar biosynthesis protein FliQ [Solibacillus]MBD8031766.1 flagellar biosynthesis protein FliQ [Solibacillus merdavium]MBD8035416.1 flagellar biosynthesis protein FliQ [Solibacillus faecavium]
MTQEMVIAVAENAVFTILIVSGPLLLIALASGLVVSIFQATTSIQEQTLAFVPKIVAVLVAIIFFGPFMISRMTDYFHDILNNLVRYIG